MSLIDHESEDCLNSELDLYQIPPTQTSINSSGYVNYHPTTSVTSSGAVEFVIQTSAENYIDLQNTILYIKSKITKRNGQDIAEPQANAAGNIAYTDDVLVAPINYFHATQFKNIEVYINGRLVSTSDNMNAYRSFFEVFLSYSHDAKGDQLRASMYHQDEGRNLDWIDSNIAKEDPDDCRNEGLRARFQKTKFSTVFETMGRIHSELFLQPKLIPGSCEIRIKLHRNAPAFSLIAKGADTEYDILIEDIVLKVRHCEIAAHIRESHAKANLTRKMKYPINHVQMKFFTRGQGRVDLSEPNLVTGTLPNRVVIGLVRSDAFNGDIRRNPFFFQNFGVDSIILRRNGKPTPYEELKMNYSSGNFLQGYWSLFTGTGKLYQDRGLALTPEQYECGYSLYAFDLSGGSCDALQLVEEGKLSLEIRLSTTSAQSITTVAFLEYNRIMELDSDGNVFINE